jgi:hypothetical protein
MKQPLHRCCAIVDEWMERYGRIAGKDQSAKSAI